MTEDRRHQRLLFKSQENKQDIHYVNKETDESSKIETDIKVY